MKTYMATFTIRAKSVKYLCVLVLCWTCLAGWAQPQYTTNFPTATSASNIPFQNTTNNKVQWLYKPADFGSAPAGFINKIYFRNQFSMLPVICSFTDFTVKMGESTMSSLPPGPWITAGMNTVFQANTFNVWPITGDWIPVVLQTPFYYDNTKNFIVEASQAGYSVGFNVMQGALNGRSLYGSLGSLLANPQNYLCEFGFDITMGSTDASIESVNLSDSICAGIQPVSVILKNNGPSILTSLTINWKINNMAQPLVNWTGSLGMGQTQLVSLGNYSFSPSVSYNFLASCYQPNGLPDPNTSNDTLQKNNIWVNPVPTVTPQSNAYSICLGDSVNIHVTLTGAAPWLLEYVYNGQTYPLQTNSSIFTISFLPVIATTYPVFFNFAKDKSGCNAASLPNISVQVKPVPAVSLGPDQAVKASGNIFLDAGPGFSSYLWNTGATTQTITVPGHTLGAGVHPFWVRVTNTSGCPASDTVLVDVIDDIGTGPLPGRNPELKIFPNPSSGKVEIQLQDACNTIVQVNLLSYDGKTVYTTDGKPDMDNRMPLDLRHLNKGMYLIRVITDHGTFHGKVLIQNN